MSQVPQSLPGVPRPGPPPGPDPRPRPGKRLIIGCDGTWLDSDMGLSRGMLPIPSNVTRLTRAIKSTSSDGISQIVYYQAGVGSQGGIFGRVVGGATGSGLAENVRVAYEFISNNYSWGDEIFLVGFSRGAFTARSIAGMIGIIGVLTKAGLPFFAEIFKDFENRYDDNYRPVFRDIPFPDKPNVRDPEYRRGLQKRGLTTLNVPIKAVAVWETVGSLGIPRIGWLEVVGLQTSKMKEYKFYDTSLDPCIENAFQALGLDEHRASFSPAVWEKPRKTMTNLRQVWFPGVHSNIGGGYADQEIANITLAWMMSQLQAMIDFQPDYIIQEFESNGKYYEKKGQDVRPWSFGEVYNSLTGIYVLGGTKTRTPGSYYRVDPVSGRPTSKPLRNTNEYMHPSVRTRLTLDGPGTHDRGLYDPKSLRDWKLVSDKGGAPVPGQGPGWMWKSRSTKKVLPESPLWDVERRLLGTDPEMFDYVVKGPRRSGRSRSRSRSRSRD